MKLILGCGLTGVSVANFFYSKNISFCIADNRKNPSLSNKLPPCKTFFNSWKQTILTGITQIIISPGILPDEKIVKWAKQKNIAIISDIDLFYQSYSAKTLIGITGSNGKSTTTTMLTECLNACGIKAVACGNIGVPILDVAANYDTFVIEISSYQLDISKYIIFDYAVVLNITADHLDRYKTLENYAKSKLKIYTLSKNNIINADEKLTNFISGIQFTTKIPKKNEIGILRCHGGIFFIKNNKVLFEFAMTKLLGEHNLENILATLTIAYALKMNLTTVIKVIKNFKGLSHRLELVKQNTKQAYFNDSKATNSSATIIAIYAILKKYNSITLILGGEKKNEDYAKLFNLINSKVASVILIGNSTLDFNSKITVNKLMAKTIKQAVNLAKNIDNECILFSPACASFDMFNDFEERGNEFIKQVQFL